MPKKYIVKIVFITTIIVLIMNFIFIIDMRNNDIRTFEEIGKQFTESMSTSFVFWIDDQIRVLDNIANDKRIIDLCLDPTNQDKIDSAELFLKGIHKIYFYYENLPIAIKLDSSITRKINGENIIIYLNQI